MRRRPRNRKHQGNRHRYLDIKARKVYEVFIQVRLAAGELEVLRGCLDYKGEGCLTAAVILATPHNCLLTSKLPRVRHGQPLVAESARL